MDLYRRAKPVEVSPAHAQSWSAFTSAHGKDKYNSIEDGRFKFLPHIQ